MLKIGEIIKLKSDDIIWKTNAKLIDYFKVIPNDRVNIYGADGNIIKTKRCLNPPEKYQDIKWKVVSLCNVVLKSVNDNPIGRAVLLKNINGSDFIIIDEPTQSCSIFYEYIQLPSFIIEKYKLINERSVPFFILF